MKIWKYDVSLEKGEYQILEIPRFSRILTVQNQGNNQCIWVEVNPEYNKEKWGFFWVGTGNPIPENVEYIGTIQVSIYVFHLYKENLHDI